MRLENGEKYKLKIISVGEMAPELFAEGLLIFFGEEAPGELQEVSIVHEHSELREDVVVGDILVIGDASFEVLALGPVVNENLKNLGHFVMKFNGKQIPENAGDLNVQKAELPEFSIGMEVKIVKGKPHDNK